MYANYCNSNHWKLPDLMLYDNGPCFFIASECYSSSPKAVVFPGYVVDSSAPPPLPLPSRVVAAARWTVGSRCDSVLPLTARAIHPADDHFPRTSASPILDPIACNGLSRPKGF